MAVRPEDIAEKTGSGFSKEITEARFKKYEPKLDEFLIKNYVEGSKHPISIAFRLFPRIRDNGPTVRQLAVFIKEKYESAGWTVEIDYPNSRFYFSKKNPVKRRRG